MVTYDDTSSLLVVLDLRVFFSLCYHDGYALLKLTACTHHISYLRQFRARLCSIHFVFVFCAFLSLELIINPSSKVTWYKYVR